jgi:hypothetical protein
MYIYSEGPFKGQQVPVGNQVWSGGSNPDADHYGNSYQFADYAFGPNGEGEAIGDCDGSCKDDCGCLSGWRVDDTLPETATEGDRYTMTVHGGSGTYQTWYVFHGGQWVEEGTTVPWQMTV